MIPLLEKAIRAGRDALAEHWGGNDGDRQQAKHYAAIMAPAIIAAALADDEATVEIMLKAYLEGRGSMKAVLAALRRHILGDQA